MSFFTKFLSITGARHLFAHSPVKSLSHLLVLALVANSIAVAGAQEQVPAGTSPVLAQSPQVDTSSIPEVPESQRRVVAAPEANQERTFGPPVKEIEVVYVGPKSVNRTVILSNMRTTVGQPYSAAAVEEDVRNLYATGLFTNLRISDEPLADGVKVVVVVQPKPLVKEIVITGTNRIKEKRVRKEVKSKPGDTLSEMQVSVDADKIKEYYQVKGFKNVQVTYKIDTNEEFGRSVVTFTINEGERSYVTLVKFEGNSALTEKELRKQMKTRKKNFFSFINKSGLFQDDQFEEDLKKVQNYYFDRGYIDMEIKDYRFEYPEKDEMTVILTVFEGIQYRVGKIEINGNELFDEKTIRSKLKMNEGGVFSPKGLEEDLKNIKDLYGEKGYIDTDVRPQRTANVESGRIDLLYNIQDGPQSFVEKIVIQGNNKTKDKVLRRELALSPGDVYDSVRSDASKKRLENLGYFEKVDITPQDTPVPNRRNMVVTVEEKRTGNITFGIGFSSVDSLLGFVELQQGNFDIQNFPYFVGAGQKFRTRLQYGLKRRDITISFTEPWFLDQRLSAGFDLFARESNYLSSLYDERRVGGALRMAKQLNQFWTASVKYQLENIEIFDVDNSASQIIKDEAGGRSKSAVTFGLTYDTRDSVFLTRKGERIDFIVEGAGGPLLGETDIYRFQIDAQKFFLLPYDLIFSINGSTGMVNHYDDTTRVPIFDRYFVGGSRSVRGFRNRDVGPKDNTGEPIGARTYGYSNFELTMPVIDRVRFAVFADAGFGDLEFADYADMIPLMNYGVGFGLRMNLPIGPLRFDLGFPLRTDDFNDSDFEFHFDVGYQF